MMLATKASVVRAPKAVIHCNFMTEFFAMMDHSALLMIVVSVAFAIPGTQGIAAV
tara:strand:+ start:169 stop:333 length:165 start_codon:yes stop_codon:yes gene_type:complete